MIENENVYVVIAKRWGDSETHNYLVGVFSKESKAISEAMIERNQRGGKYECFVYCAWVDTVSKGATEIYSTEVKCVN